MEPSPSPSPFEVEAQHLRELLMNASRELASAGFEGLFGAQVGAVIDQARRCEECKRELGLARDRVKGLEGALVEAVSSLKRDGVGRNEAIARAGEFIPVAR